MTEIQTPQEALDVAAASTRQARDAAALPTWGPIAAGVAGGLAVMLLCTVVEIGVVSPLGWGAGVAGIAAGVVYYRLLGWLKRVRRERGIIPLPLAEWKQNVLLIVVIMVVPPVGLAGSGLDVWLRLLSAAIMGVWIWFTQARPRFTWWKNRHWKS
ncbi:hypothetical protein [Nocardia concava]|uniref:hypothetical protein n=1 Tax=Nocardia concava TaxID=257281 RepID=UPI0012FC0A6E|nr:hypothetical protein [Nocardia concava]